MTVPTDTELKALPPCRWCGDSNTACVQPMLHTGDQRWAAVCFTCDAQGPKAETHAEALAAYARPLPPPEQEGRRCAKCQFEESATIHQEAYRNVGPAHAFVQAALTKPAPAVDRKDWLTAERIESVMGEKGGITGAFDCLVLSTDDTLTLCRMALYAIQKEEHRG